MEPLPVGKILFLTLLNKTPNSSGYDLMQQVLELTDSQIVVQSGSIYPTLRDLEKGGLLSSNQQTTGRKRRLYTITAEGKSELAKMGRLIMDTQCGFKLFKHNIAKEIFKLQKINKFASLFIIFSKIETEVFRHIYIELMRIIISK